jgi:hypothetical protein
MKYVLALITGIVFGSIANMAIIMVSGVVIAPPDGVDTSTMEGLVLAMPLMQPKHFLMPFLAHTLGTLVGAWIAARVAPTNKMGFALVIGAFFFIGGAYMVMSLPSPRWFNVVDLGLAYFPMAYIGWVIAARKNNNPDLAV